MYKKEICFAVIVLAFGLGSAVQAYPVADPNWDLGVKNEINWSEFTVSYEPQEGWAPSDNYPASGAYIWWDPRHDDWFNHRDNDPCGLWFNGLNDKWGAGLSGTGDPCYDIPNFGHPDEPWLIQKNDETGGNLELSYSGLPDGYYVVAEYGCKMEGGATDSEWQAEATIEGEDATNKSSTDGYDKTAIVVLGNGNSWVKTQAWEDAEETPIARDPNYDPYNELDFAVIDGTINVVLNDHKTGDDTTKWWSLYGLEITRVAYAGQTRRPNPETNCSGAIMNTELNWAAGAYADSHNVYFGTSFGEVNDADITTTGIWQTTLFGGSNTTWDPNVILDANMTYYWRIDANDTTEPCEWKGPVWSFTVANYSRGYDWARDNENSLHYSEFELSYDPEDSPCQTRTTERTFDQLWEESGDGASRHPDAPYLVQRNDENVDNNPLTFTLGDNLPTGYYVVGIKNINMHGGHVPGNMTISATVEGEQASSSHYNDVGYDRLALSFLGDGSFVELPGGSYDVSTEPGFYVGDGTIDITLGNCVTMDGWQAYKAWFSFDEFVIARVAQPDLEGARNQPLNWLPTDYAVTYDVYFGTDFNDVNDANDSNSVFQQNQAGNVYATVTPPSLLDFNEIYFWRVDEVNSGDVNTPRKSFTNSFVVADHLLIDDMETYRDQSPGFEWSAINTTWLSGYRATDNPVDAILPGASGSVITSSIDVADGQVFQGVRSMVYDYDNDGTVSAFVYWPDTFANTAVGYNAPYYSEIIADTTGTWAIIDGSLGKDWTNANVKAIWLGFSSDTEDSHNDISQQMYIVLTDSADVNGIVKYGDNLGEDMADINDGDWHGWYINLQDFNDQGVDLTDVNHISIGFGERGELVTPGGSGRVYFDSIRLYQSACLPDKILLYGDSDDDCDVDFVDVVAMLNEWLDNNQ